MALRIRLARGGAKKRPFYRIVVAEATAPRDGRFVERIGSYNPMLPQGHDQRVVIDIERAKHWLGVGAIPSDRIARFLGHANVIAMPAQKVNPQKSQPKEKAQERARAQAEAAVAAAEAAKAAAEAPAPAPVVEAAPEPVVEAEAAPAVEEPAAEAVVEAAPEAAAETPAEPAAE